MLRRRFLPHTGTTRRRTAPQRNASGANEPLDAISEIQACYSLLCAYVRINFCRTTAQAVRIFTHEFTIFRT